MKPLKMLEKNHAAKKFEGMGFVTTYTGGSETDASEGEKEVFTWNIYGIVKDHSTTFGDLKEYVTSILQIHTRVLILTHPDSSHGVLHSWN